MIEIWHREMQIQPAVFALPHRVPRISFTRVPDKYLHRVFEAQRTVSDDGKNKYLFVAGGCFKFPGVTKECWLRRVTGEAVSWEHLADMPPPLAIFFCSAGGNYGSRPRRTNEYQYNCKTN